MFAYLVGRVAGVTEDNLVLEVGQIGFNIKIPSSLPSLLPPIGEEVKIYTYTCVREDAFLLYGFLSQDDLAADHGERHRSQGRSCHSFRDERG